MKKKSNIISIEKIDNYEKDVYDITVKDNHNYFVSNALVHNCIIIEEAHRCSDVAISERIMPMLSRKHRQMIKIGVALYKNNFKESFDDEQYVKVAHDYLNCPILKLTGIVRYKGKEYPKNVVDLMPWEAKLRIFGDMAHKLPKKGKISMLDFITQYELMWQETVNNFLTKKQQENLMGKHEEVDAYDEVGTNVFGLDTAAGTLREDAEDLDDTALVIWRIFRGQYEKIFAWDVKDTPLKQYKPILAILKRFRVQYGLIDYSNCGTVFPEMLRQDGVNCEGIMYRMSEPDSHKPYKYAMLDYFSSLVDLEMIKYPRIFDDNGKIMCGEVMYKHYMQWTMLQKRQTEKTLSISAPAHEHDDGPLADVQAIWAAKRVHNLIRSQSNGTDFVFHSGNAGLMNR